MGEQIALDPFKSVIESSEVRNGPGMWAVHTTRAELYGRLWCVLEIVVAAGENVKINAALSGLYAAQISDVRKLLGVKPRTQNAKCSVTQDEEMIRGVVADKFGSQGGFDFLDAFIFKFRTSILNDMRSKIDEIVDQLKSYVTSVSAEEFKKRYDGLWMKPGDMDKLQSEIKLLQTNASDGKQVPIGIDLGNSYTKIAKSKSDLAADIWEGAIIEDVGGEYSFDSVVSFCEVEDSNGKTVPCAIGSAAKTAYPRHLDVTVLSTKRLIGCKFQDPAVQDDIKKYFYKVGAGPGDVPMAIINFQGEEKKYYPEEIASMCLVYAKETAETNMGTRVRDAVITVPASFTSEQRQNTKEAAALAGLNVLELLDDAMAIAIGYGFTKNEEPPQNVLICDFGGGRTDFTIFRCDKGNVALKANVSLRLGGLDLEDRLFQSLCDEFQENSGLDLRGNGRAEGRLRNQAERVKRMLSAVTQAEVDLDSIFCGEDFCTMVTRARFEEVNADYYKKMQDGLAKCFDDSGLRKEDVDKVAMVGGVARMPKVQAIVQDFFEGEAKLADAPKVGDKPCIVDNIASLGAAQRAATLVASKSASKARVESGAFGADLTKDIPQDEMRAALLRRELELMEVYFEVKNDLDVREDPAAMKKMFVASAQFERCKLNIMQARALALRDEQISEIDIFQRLEKLGTANTISA